MWSNVTTGIARRNEREIALEPGELQAVDVAVVVLVVDVDRVQPDEVHAAARERVVVGPEVMVVHPPAIERMRRAHVRGVALDAEVLMVARHGEHRRAKRRRLAHEQIVVARRLGLADAERVAHEIAGDEQQVRVDRVDERAKPLRARHRRGRDVRVRRVDERELGRSWSARASGNASGAPSAARQNGPTAR